MDRTTQGLKRFVVRPGDSFLSRRGCAKELAWEVQEEPPMNTVPIHVVDAFTDEPYAGNPAGVCLLAAPAPQPWMQRVAREMAHAETAFLWPIGDTPSGVWSLRWFTPVVEVDLCGHATLAATHTLWERGLLAQDGGVAFDTRSGRLGAQLEPTGFITLDFPLDRPEPMTCSTELASALGLRIGQVARARYDDLIEVANADVVRCMDPDMSKLARATRRGVAVTAESDIEGVDFVSRFFAPAAGIPEDPVTGSAHCFLAPWWQRRLKKPAGTMMVGRQLSARGGTVRVRIEGERVHLIGQAVTTMRGELLSVPDGVRAL